MLAQTIKEGIKKDLAKDALDLTPIEERLRKNKSLDWEEVNLDYCFEDISTLISELNRFKELAQSMFEDYIELRIWVDNQC